MLLTLLINGFRVPMFINMLITRLGIISPTLVEPTHFKLRTIQAQLIHLPTFFEPSCTKFYKQFEAKQYSKVVWSTQWNVLCANSEVV